MIGTRSWTRRAALVGVAGLTCLVGAGVGCRGSQQAGGDPDFLAPCGEGIGECAQGSQCVCGACTAPCEDAPDCHALAALGSCRPPQDILGSACGASVDKVCAAACTSDDDCGFIEAGVCDAGLCRRNAPPLVMLLLDSSGSMELVDSDCMCESVSCDECLADCASGERTRWGALSEALGGSYVQGQCTTLERTPENGATFDLGYYRPYNRPPLESERRADGILEQFANRADFGVATFDGWDTYLGSKPLVTPEEFDFAVSAGVGGAWSYGSHPDGPRMRADGSLAGHYRYAGYHESYFMDTGIRGPGADNGGLQTTLGAVSIEGLADTVARTRPWGGTPIAAALDDLDHYFRTHASLSKREVHVVLVGDGRPDDDYRKFGCDCTQNEDPQAQGYCGEIDSDPELFHCPYPLAEIAARTLRCGLQDGSRCEDGVVTAVHAIYMGAQDVAEARTAFDSIAALGGGISRSSDASQIRATLAAALDEILQ